MSRLSVLLLGVRNPSEETLLFTDRVQWLTVAKMYASGFGKPVATLDTSHVKRFLYKNGESIDLVVEPFPAGILYEPVQLCQNVLGLFSSEKSPGGEAGAFVKKLEREGHTT